MPECPESSVTPRDLAVVLPGGAEIRAQMPIVDPTGLQVALQMVGQSGGATAPIVPVFNLIEAVLALKSFAEAVPELVTNPPAVVEAIEQVIEKTAAVAGLVPQLSVPRMVLGMIDTILALLAGVVEELEGVAAYQGRIEQVREQAEETGNAALAQAVACADDVAASRVANLEEALGPVSSFIALINTLAGLIGLPTVPEIGTLSSDASEALEGLDRAITVLQGVRNLIPL